MSEIRTILQNKHQKIRASFSRDALIFLFCILISTALWFIHSLSKTKDAELMIPVVYKNIPTNCIITDTLQEGLKVKVTDSGFSILMYELKRDKKSVTIDFDIYASSKKNKLFIPRKTLRKKVRKSISSTMNIKSVEPQEIKLSYEKLYEKTIPIKLVGEIKLSKQYVLKDSVRLVPQSIKVYGAKSMLDTLKAVHTKNVVFNVTESTTFKTALQAIRNVRFTTNTIKVIVPVELFTEKTLTIPVFAKNFPANIQLKTFPATIKVSFIVGLSKFKNITTEDVHAFIDYESIVNNKEGKQAVEISTLLSSISNLNYTPKTVEYILEEK